jgi:uncharacterized protein (TIGR03083 family)
MDSTDRHDGVLRALRDSTERLRTLVEDLDDAQIVGPSYCRDWSLADVLSHLGSGALIMERRLHDTLAGVDMPDEFAPTLWDEWNAKTPRSKVTDGLAADEQLIESLEAIGQEDRARLIISVGPLALGFDEFASMRLNEHACHTWDVEVMFDPTARIPDGQAALVVGNLELIARFTARPVDGPERRLRIRTIDPVRLFSIDVTPVAAAFAEWDGAGEPDLELPAEAFCRLVYGRLDPEHTPDVRGSRDDLDLLRRVFPGP